MKDLQKIEKIPGCYSYFLATASKYLDCQKNIRNVKLPVVAGEVNTCYEAARLSAFKVKYIWVEIRERWKAWTEIVNCFGSGSDIINWHSGTIDTKEERDWDWILRVSHHFTFFFVNVTFSFLFFLICLFLLCLAFSRLLLFYFHFFS